MPGEMDLLRRYAISHEKILNPQGERDDLIRFLEEGPDGGVAPPHEFAHPERGPPSARHTTTSNLTANRSRHLTQNLAHGYRPSRSVQCARGAGGPVERAVAHVGAPAHQRSALTRHRGCVVREDDSHPSGLGLAHQPQRYPSRERMHMQDVGSLIVQNAPELAGGIRVAVAIEILQVFDSIRDAEAPHRKAPVVVAPRLPSG